MVMWPTEKRGRRRNVQSVTNGGGFCSWFLIDETEAWRHTFTDFHSKKMLTMNIHFSSITGTSATCPAISEKDEAASSIVVSQKVRDQSSRSEERVAPLVGKKRSRPQDDAVSECHGRSRFTRSSLTLIQRSSTTESLKRRLSKTQDAGLMKEETADSFVRRIERLLFLSTGPNEENVVADTEQALNRRLHQLMGTVLSRRILREKGSGANRLIEFERGLGASTVQDISAVCREIERVKLERAKMGCGSYYKHGVCTNKGRDAYTGVRFLGKIPEPVRNLFFCTRLPNLWNCETNSVHRFTVQEWNELYFEAVRNLKMYREYMSQEKEQDV